MNNKKKIAIIAGCIIGFMFLSCCCGGMILISKQKEEKKTTQPIFKIQSPKETINSPKETYFTPSKPTNSKNTTKDEITTKNPTEKKESPISKKTIADTIKDNQFMLHEKSMIGFLNGYDKDIVDDDCMPDENIFLKNAITHKITFKDGSKITITTKFDDEIKDNVIATIN